MHNKFFILLISLFFSYTICSECTEKANANHDTCRAIIVESEEKSCIYDENEHKCVEKECSQLPINDCSQFKYSKTKQCIADWVEDKCKLFTCEELKSDCSSFQVEENAIVSDSQCGEKKEGNGCEIQTCSEMSTDNCNQYISNNPGYKCELNEGTGKCEIKMKECEDFDYFSCGGYLGYEADKQCVPNDRNKKCKYVKCEELMNSECSKFAGDGEFACVPSGGRCAKKKCEDFSTDTCEQVNFGYPDFKCIVSGEKCILSKCSDLTSNCESFIPVDILYKCVEEEGYDNCHFVEKECGELPIDKCDLFNRYKDIEDGKCVYWESKGKCSTDTEDSDNSAEKNIKFTILLFTLIFFLL